MRSPALRVAWLGLLIAAAGAAPGLRAQAVQVNLESGVSHARPPSGVEAEPSTYALLGARFKAGPTFGSAYGALGIEESAADWAAASLGARLETPRTRRLGLGLVALAGAFTVGAPIEYRAATGRVLPELRLSLGTGSLTLRGHGGLGRSQVEDARQVPSASVVTDLWLYGGALELFQRVGGLRFRVGAEALRSQGGSYRSAYASCGGSLGRVPWSLRLRLWDTPDELELEVGIDLSMPLVSRFSAELAAGRSAPDPLLGTPAAVDGSLLLSWNVAEVHVRAPALYRVEPASPRPQVSFRLRHGTARRVSLIGDFSDWEPIPMRREGGKWIAVLPVEPGVYHFGFLVDGAWYVPEDAPGRVTDEYGRVNATLVVSG